MKKLIKNLISFVVSVMLLAISAHAVPITITDVTMNKVNGEDVVLVTLNNSNLAPGNYNELSFTIEELGTTKNVGAVKVVNTTVLTYKLSEVTDNYDLLKRGETYRLTVSTETDSKTISFLYGKVLNDNIDSTGLGLALEDIKINGESIDNDELSVMNGESLEVKLRFTANENFDDARIMIFMEGYEHSPIVDSTDIFAVKSGKTYFKTLTVNLPADMNSEKTYKLRIVGANDLSGITYKEYNVYVDTQRHRVDILDLITTPASGVEPGQNIIANVRMKNRGQKSEDSVKVSISIPELGIKESSYVSNLNKDEVATSDDMLVYIPESAKAGEYEVLVTLSYNDGYVSSVSKYSLNVLSPKIVEEKNLIVNFNDNLELKSGEEKTFDIIIANPNSDSKPISVAALDNSWADVEVTPSLAMVKGGEDATFKVKVTPKSAVEGEKQLNLVVKEGASIISDFKVSTYVEKSTEDTSINWVNVALVVLLVIAIIILLSLVITIAKRNKGDDEEVTEEYY
jgi:hypothetical protein